MQKVICAMNLLFLAALLPATGHAAVAGEFPSRPIRIISPFSPGGGTEPLARMVSQGLNEAWGQPVILDFRPGAGTMIGTELGKNAEPTGHTILIVAASFAINPSLYKNVKYNPVRDFSPLTMQVSFPFLLAVNAGSPATDVKKLIAAAKANPGKMTFSSSGTGNTNHLAGELFKSKTGIEMTHVPYKGGGPALTAAISGEVSMLFTTVLSSLPFVKSGRLRALGISTAERSRFAPDIPTLAETVPLPGFEVLGWYGFVAPAATPRPIVEKLNQGITAVLKKESVKERIIQTGVEAWPTSADEARKFITSEVKRWDEVITRLGLVAD